MELDRLLSMWWEPATPTQEYAGQVSLDADGAVTIQLVGTLGGSPLPMKDPEPAVLHGLGNQGPFFTARKLIRAGARIGMPGFPSEVLRPQSLIVGAHVDETTLYDEAILQATYLSDWLQESGIRIEMRQGSNEQKGSVAASYVWPEIRTSQVAPGVTISTWSGHQGTPMRAGYTISETVALKITVETGVLVDDLVRDYVMPILDLVSFATGRSNAVDRLTIRTPSVTQTIGEQIQREDLEYVTEWIVKRPKVEPERLMIHHMRFALMEAPMGFDLLIQRWYKLYKDLRPSLAPYFGLLYAPPTYVDLRLVSISQALEAYHRASKLRRAAMSKEDFAAFKKALLQACPPGKRGFLELKLGYLNEISQVDRTLQLIDRAKVALRRLLESRPDFAVDFINARNIKTHPDQEKGDATGTQMYDLTRVGTFLFEANVMLDLGFDDTQCAALFERQPEYMHLVNNPPAD